jgi:2-hydroxychromene-2-carboxylate isomerase
MRYVGQSTMGYPMFPNGPLPDALYRGDLRSDPLAGLAIAAQQLCAFEQISGACSSSICAASDDLTGAKVVLSSPLVVRSRRNYGQWAESADVEAKLATNNARAAPLGVFGVPTFFVNDEMFFGENRLNSIN